MSTFLQPGGGAGVAVTEALHGLLDVLPQEAVTRQKVSGDGAVEQPQLVVEDFDLQTENQGSTSSSVRSLDKNSHWCQVPAGLCFT